MVLWPVSWLSGKETEMYDLWLSLPTELKALVIGAVVYLVDFYVTKSPNPIDNLIWRWLKKK